jgi:4-hydroxybenzoate polyprenyltransferase
MRRGPAARRSVPIKPYTDIADHGWITMLPPRWRPFALIARLDRPIGAWLLFLPGLWAILLTRRPDPVGARLIVLFGVGAILMRAAGCIVNDIWDRELDRRVTRTANRPLAAGTLTVNGAMIFLVVLLLLSLGILMSLGHLAQIVGAASLILVALYPLAKRVTSWPQLVLGLTFGWGVPLGAAAASGRLSLAALALYGAAIAWILGYDTIYAHQDREDDAMVGVGSTALALGRYTQPFLVLCYAAMIALAAVAGTLAGLEGWFYVALALPAVLLARQVIMLDIDDPARCLALFRSNREVGLAIATAILVGWL